MIGLLKFLTLFHVSLFVVSAVFLPPRDRYPQVIAHRGASGYVPEHSLAGYRLAMDLLTDYIEPDLCLSKDGVFVAMHDLLLDDTTNVASIPVFDDKKTTKSVDGKTMSGYFISDFTLSELQELKLNQRLAGRSTLFDGLLQIPTFTQIMELVHSHYNDTGITVGMYVELKHPSFYSSLGFNMADMLLKQLEQGLFAVKGDDVPSNLTQVLPVVIQCFEASTLQYLKSNTDIPLVLLIDKPVEESWTQGNLESISKYAKGVGPEKSYFVDGSLESGLEKVSMAHSLGLAIHPWTFREDSGIESRFDGDFQSELLYFYCCLGMDGLFSEFPDMSREVVDKMLAAADQRYLCSTTCSL